MSGWRVGETGPCLSALAGCGSFAAAEATPSVLRECRPMGRIHPATPCFPGKASAAVGRGPRGTTGGLFWAIWGYFLGSLWWSFGFPLALTRYVNWHGFFRGKGGFLRIVLCTTGIFGVARLARGSKVSARPTIRRKKCGRGPIGKFIGMILSRISTYPFGISVMRTYH